MSNEEVDNLNTAELFTPEGSPIFAPYYWQETAKWVRSEAEFKKLDDVALRHLFAKIELYVNLALKEA